MRSDNWNGFKEGVWQNEINVRDFIQQNYTEYKGDDSFLAEATPRTKELMKKLNALLILILLPFLLLLHLNRDILTRKTK